MSDVAIRFIGIDQVTGVVNKIDASIAGMTKGKFGLTDVVAGVTGAIGAFYGLQQAVEVAKKAFEFGREGAELLRLRDAGTEVARQMGADMDEIVAKMHEASLGMVSDTDLIAAANKAMMLGVTSDADQLASLLQIAAFKARAMGMETGKAFEDIITGIGRLSPKILDNLGIILNAEGRYAEYAQATGRAVDSLSQMEKQQIVLNGVLAEGNKQLEAAGGLALDSAGKFEQYEAAMKNASDNMKMAFAPVLANDVVPGLVALASIMERITGLFDQQGKKSNNPFYDSGMIVKGGFSVLLKDLEIIDLLIKSINGELDQPVGEDWVDRMRDGTLEVTEALVGGQDAWNAYWEAVGAQKGWDATSDRLTAQAKALGLVSTRLGEVEDKAEDTGAALQDAFSFSIPNIADKINNMFDQVKWKKLGGPELEKLFTDTASKILAWDPEGSKALDEYGRKGLEVFTALQVKMGELEMPDAIAQLAEALGVSKDEAEKILQLLLQMDGMQLQAYLTINTTTRNPNARPGTYNPSTGTYTRPDGTTYVQDAYGGDFIVPAGYPNDTFTVGTTSGERVTVTPASDMDKGSEGSGFVVNMTVNAARGQSEQAIAAAVIDMLGRRVNLARLAGVGYAG